MTTSLARPAQERRARAHKEISQLISQRNAVLSQYYALANHEKGSNEVHEITFEMLQEFCQILIDYIATGHFELYQRIEEGKEQRDEMSTLANQIYPRFSETTKIAVEFNDMFDTTQNVEKNAQNNLSKALSKLGEELASRIELEDRFINSLLSHKVKAEQPAMAVV